MRKIQPVQKFALKLLAKRQHTELELRDKLLQNGYDPEDISETIEHFRDLGYLDDYGYAQRFVESKRRTSKTGKGLLRSQLQAKGIPSEIAISAVNADHDEEDELNIALNLSEKKVFQWQKSGGADPNKLIKQIYGHLKRKGFSDTIIVRVIHSVSQTITQSQ